MLAVNSRPYHFLSGPDPMCVTNLGKEESEKYKWQGDNKTLFQPMQVIVNHFWERGKICPNIE